MTHKKYIKIGIIFLLTLSSIYLIYICTSRRKRIQTTDAISQKNIPNIEELSPQVQKNFETIHTYTLRKNWSYDEAINSITWENTEDRFNRSIILFTQAQHTQKSNSIQLLCAQSKNAIAKSEAINSDKNTAKIINQNKQYIHARCEIHGIKTCYENKNLNTKILQKTQNTNKTRNLQEQEIIENIKKNNEISPNCKKQILQSSQNKIQLTKQIGINLNTQIQETEKLYIENLKNPKTCDITQTLETLKENTENLKTIKKETEKNKMFITTIRQNNSTIIIKICEQGESDAITTSIQKIKQDLQNLLTPTQNTNSQKLYEKIQTESQQEIQNKNDYRIQRNIQIKYENYIPKDQIKNLFKSFFGNLKDLEKQ